MSRLHAIISSLWQTLSRIDWLPDGFEPSKSGTKQIQRYEILDKKRFFNQKVTNEKQQVEAKFCEISWQIDKNSYHLKALKIINFQY